MNDQQRRTYAALHGSLPPEGEKRSNIFRLHAGVLGAHPQFGGVETAPADLEADDTRFGPEARFTMGPEGRDTMGAGGDVMPKAKKIEDTEPYLRRREGQGTQLPLGTEGAFKPTDPVQHFVRLKHPNLMDYNLEYQGDDRYGHQINAYHQNRPVGFLRWNGRDQKQYSEDESYAPGEIQGVSVHPEHRGSGLSTAMWDYAQAKVALHGIQEPVHSADRSTAGNHWAHFVGGASMARQSGQNAPEYFEGSWG